MEDIKKIWEELIKVGILAPSGDNSQPWKFVIDNNSLNIYLVPENDNPAYNLDYRGSVVAVGAFVENVYLAALEKGFELKVVLYSPKENNLLITKLDLEYKGGDLDKKTELYKSIFSRATNRKPYETDSLDDKLKSSLIEAGKKFEDVHFSYIDDQKKIKKVAKAVSNNEQIVLENKPLHKYFFEHVRWDEKEEKQKRNGLYIKTLEFDPPTTFFFKRFRNWKVMQFVNKINFAKLIAKVNGKIYAKSSLLGLIAITEDTAENYFNAGRVLQSIWLMSELNKLSFQMVTGVLFFNRRIKANKIDGFFKKKHEKLIKDSVIIINSNFPVSNKEPVLLFRIGVSSKPSGLSSRIDPNIKFKN